VTEKEVQIVDLWYDELKDNLYLCSNAQQGAAALIFLAYVTYHLISKLRGNEKNAQQNNFGIVLAVLGLYCYLHGFSDNMAYSVIYDSWEKWRRNNYGLY